MPSRRLNFVCRPHWLKRHSLPRGIPGPLLTFDDGPDPDTTPRVLDLLDEAGAKAIFFVVGERAKNNSALVRRIKESGHEIGNHSYSHKRFGSFRDVLADIQQCQAIVTETTGIAPRWFRPPYGRVTFANWLATRWPGMRMLLWSLDTGDWRCKTETEADVCATELEKEIRPRDVVLLHDDRILTASIVE
jgi:peptidoglycan/xylan/chitin deacetylase (PgdA/CDA1 family)